MEGEGNTNTSSSRIRSDAFLSPFDVSACLWHSPWCLSTTSRSLSWHCWKFCSSLIWSTPRACNDVIYVLNNLQISQNNALRHFDSMWHAVICHHSRLEDSALICCWSAFLIIRITYDYDEEHTSKRAKKFDNGVQWLRSTSLERSLPWAVSLLRKTANQSAKCTQSVISVFDSYLEEAKVLWKLVPALCFSIQECPQENQQNFESACWSYFKDHFCHTEQLLTCKSVYNLKRLSNCAHRVRVFDLDTGDRSR